jgi:hypothetical protein
LNRTQWSFEITKSLISAKNMIEIATKLGREEVNAFGSEWDEGD